jgi:hypothetical protein
MGIDYSFALGIGFTVDPEELSEALRNDNARAKRWRAEFGLETTSTIVVLVTEIFRSHRMFARIVVIDDDNRFGFNTSLLAVEEMSEKSLWEQL